MKWKIYYVLSDKNHIFFEYIDKGFKKSVFELAQKIEDFILTLEDYEMTNDEYREKYREFENYMDEMNALVLHKMYG